MSLRRPGFWVGLSILWIPLAFLFDGVTILVLPLRLGGDASTFGVVSLDEWHERLGQPRQGARKVDRQRRPELRTAILVAVLWRRVPAHAGVSREWGMGAEWPRIGRRQPRRPSLRSRSCASIATSAPSSTSR